MCSHRSASGKLGRSPRYSEAAILFCLTIKSLFSQPQRQAMGMAQSLLKLAGLDWQVPDFTTVGRRKKHLSVTIGAQPTTMGLHVLVDSTGLKMLSEDEWNTKSIRPVTVTSGARFTLALTWQRLKSGHRSDKQRRWRRAETAFPARLDFSR